jgi:hypothetical protein
MAKQRKDSEPGKTKSETATPAAALSAFVKFTSSTIHRSQLKNAKYNPRTITDDARKKLKKNIERVGLLEPPIWNKRSGNIVGGHQRVATLDALHGTDDYLIPVSEVDLDDKTEKEQNVFLNNADAQGEFDMAALGKMFTDDKIEVENTGFDLGLAHELWGDQAVSGESAKLLDVAEKYAQIKENFKKKKAKTKDEVDDPNFYLVMVFKNYDARKAFTDKFDLDDIQFVDARVLEEKMHFTFSDR